MLQHWKDKFQDNDVTYDEILGYTVNHKWLLSLGQNVRAKHLVVDTALIKKAKTDYLYQFDWLNVYLLKYIPDQCEGRWCKVPSVLDTYGVTLPECVQDIILKKVAFPGETLIPNDKKIKSLHPSTSGRFQPGHNLSLSLHKSISLAEIIKVVQELQEFINPLLDHLDMVIFFRLHNTILCDKYLRHFLKEIEEVNHNFRSSAVLFSTHLGASPDSLPPPVVHDNTVINSTNNFKKALSSTRELLLKIMEGTATYSEIVAEDEGMFNGLDIKKEFATLHEYSKHCKLTGVTLAGLECVKSMLELFQYTTHVNSIHNVCYQYSTLSGCRDDPKLKELCSIIEDHVKSKDRFQLTPLKAKEKMVQVKEILCLGENTSSKCLEIFAAMADSAAFYQFIRDKQFHGHQGQVIFQQQYELITAQLQHEEYDESVLNHLLIAFKIITPFMDSSKNLTDLMVNVIALNETHGFKQLYTVNSNINLIRLWFSRAEVSTYGIYVKSIV